MRPFRFFFGLSIAIVLFFFLARVFFFALIMAAIFSFVFFVLRSIGSAFQKFRWGDRGWYIEREERGQYFENDFSFEKNHSFNDREYSPFQERIIRIQ